MTAGSNSELIYRIPGRPGGQRPGAHRSMSLGPGIEFATHARLFDIPDPRRIDLSASLRRVPREWLVRASRQSSAASLQLLMDVSPSMHFGDGQSKLDVVADFIESLGHSAWRGGDSIGLCAFDHECRDDLHAPARLGRGVGHALAATTRSLQPRTPESRRTRASRIALNDALHDCADQMSHASKLVFLLSDFHWPNEAVALIMKRLESLTIVPLVVWDRAETTPPSRGRWLRTRELESGQRRSLWLRSSVREHWRERVIQRRETLISLFAKHQTRPFFMESGFHADALSKYFLEQAPG